MTAISRSKVKIAILEAGTDPSAVAPTDFIKGEIKSYSKSGGERDVESDPHFGGYVDKEKPVSQVEVSFEVTPSLEDADRWDALAHSVDSSGVYTLAGEVPDKAVFIEATDGTNYKSWAFNNCNVTVLDLEHNADDNLTNTMNMKFSPVNNNGVSNYQSQATSLAALTAWSGLDNN